METSNMNSAAKSLPVTHNLTLAYISSLAIALIIAVVSVAGLVYQPVIYPADELLQTFVPNDVVNLVVGVPILLVSMWLAQRGQLIGLLFWPGALFYGLYNYLIYLFGMPLNVMFPLYLTIVTLSIYTTIGLVASIQGEAVKQRLNGRVPEKFAGGILVGFGILFMLRTIGVMVGALASQTPIARPELALLVSDFVFIAAWVIGGVLLWRRQALGYVGGTGLLFQASMLFISLLFFLLLQTLLTDAPFNLADIVAVFIMALISFIPFALFVRGVIRS